MPVLPNARHERFAQELAKGKSATQAYIAAGFEPHRQNAARLMTNDDIADRVEELLAAGARRAEITVERVLREYARIGFADIRRAVQWHALQSETGEEDEDGVPSTRTVNEVVLVDSDEIDRDTALAISEIAQTKDGLKVKFHDKKGALDSIARHLGMFVDRSEVTQTVRDITDEPVNADEWADQHVTAH
jgi:phage terminase small subunit